MTILGAVGLLGFVYQLVRRRYLLPAWVVLVFVLDPRGAATMAMLPLALLVAVAVDEVVLARVPGAGIPIPQGCRGALSSPEIGSAGPSSSSLLSSD